MTITRKEEVDSDRGMIYIIKMVLDDGDIVYKVGLTKREKIQDRLGEVVISFFNAYRYIPRTTVKRFRITDGCYSKEAKLHRELKEHRYKFKTKFCGSTEFFKCDEETVITAYDNGLR
jgi:hypothetical protein